MKSIKTLLQIARRELSASSPTPYLDAQVILSHLLNLSAVSLISNSEMEVDERQQELYFELIRQRKGSMPVAYITGKREFFGLEFEVNTDTLIPRPETELIVELALSAAMQISQPLTILDLGTGSGCIAIALADGIRKLALNFHLTAIDKSEAALRVAKRNIARYKLEDDISLRHGSWYEGLAQNQEFNIIVANPPYISLQDSNVSNETSYEPRSALYSGDSGLDDIAQILSQAQSRLSPAGVLFCEIGCGQRAEIRELAKNLAILDSIDFKTDLAGLDRVLVYQKP